MSKNEAPDVQIMNKTSISALILALFCLSPIAKAAYQDVPSDHIYIQGVHYLELEGAIDPGTDFHPDEVLNRAALFKMLFKVLGTELPDNTENKPFRDVPEDQWFTPYALLAGQHQLLTGESFQAGQSVQKIEALNILLKAYGIGPSLVNDKNADLFLDVNKEHPHYATIARAVTLGIIDSDPNTYYKPYAQVSRAEFAQLLYAFDQWYTMGRVERQDFYKSDIFAQTWETILANFYTNQWQEIDEEALFQAAMKGLLDSLDDPYTTYFSPSDTSSFFTQINGEFEGIGALLLQDERSGAVYISGFVEGSPGQEAGLEVGDVITEVNGTALTGLSIEAVVSLIKGEAGTIVDLSVNRSGKDYRFSITRKAISIQLESGDIWEDDIWYMDINAFSAEMPAYLMDIIFDLEEEVEQPRAIIIDLRGNGGGYLNSGTFLAGLFLPQFTPLIHLDYGDGDLVPIVNSDWGPYKDYPLYIWVDGLTASASEIATATLQEKGATVLGQQSFGKGSTQTVTQFWDGSSIKITFAHWLSGEKNSIHEQGITPNITIPLESEDALWLEEVLEDLDEKGL